MNVSSDWLGVGMCRSVVHEGCGGGALDIGGGGLYVGGSGGVLYVGGLRLGVGVTLGHCLGRWLYLGVALHGGGLGLYHVGVAIHKGDRADFFFVNDVGLYGLALDVIGGALNVVGCLGEGLDRGGGVHTSSAGKVASQIFIFLEESIDGVDEIGVVGVLSLEVL